MWLPDASFERSPRRAPSKHRGVVPSYQVIHGDCRATLSDLPDASVDAVITDPPYPEIDRDYGRLSEPEWHELMRAVVRECRRILSPRGSAVFVLQPNSERLGRMRLWLWEFLVEHARAWNLVQDIYWWNTAALPVAACQSRYGLTRPSVKLCAWFGAPDCYRDQGAVLWSKSEAYRLQVRADEWERRSFPSGMTVNRGRMAEIIAARGGVTPYNLLPIANTASSKGSSAGALGHGAGTPFELCDWWTRYLVPPGGLSLDPFAGAGTTGVAALRRGGRWIGVEAVEKYAAIANERLAREALLS